MILIVVFNGSLFESQFHTTRLSPFRFYAKDTKNANCVTFVARQLPNRNGRHKSAGVKSANYFKTYSRCRYVSLNIAKMLTL